MGKSYRKERLNESIKELLGELILNGIKDPRVGLVTITSVSVSADLTSAKVYFSVMGGEDQREESKKGLISAKNFLRRAVGHELKLRSAPEFRFIYDDTLDRSIEIEETIKKLHRETDDPAA